MPAPDKHPEELLRSALGVIDVAFRSPANAQHIAPMFSGGHDSLCACFVASQHPRFAGTLHHINTGIGSKLTRAFVDSVCQDFGWALRVYKSKVSYEDVVRQWRRNHRFLTFDGRTLTVKEWCRVLGLSRITIISRLRRGWSDAAALSKVRTR